jgi:hypothetical protein
MFILFDFTVLECTCVFCIFLAIHLDVLITDSTCGVAELSKKLGTLHHDCLTCIYLPERTCLN